MKGTARQGILNCEQRQTPAHPASSQIRVPAPHSAKCRGNGPWPLSVVAAVGGGKICWLIVFCLGIFESEAHAYADPGSGLLLWQAFLMGALGVLYYARKFWRRILPRRKDKEDKDGFPERGGE